MTKEVKHHALDFLDDLKNALAQMGGDMSKDRREAFEDVWDELAALRKKYTE